MANSSLERTGEKQPVVGKGHGTEALGPSDLSDTGSDVTGAPGLNEERDTLHLQPGTTSDPDHNPQSQRKTAGPDLGDENLDSDSDSGGTGERAAAGRDAPPPNDQQLEIIDARGEGEPGEGDAMTAGELEQELVEEDREFGDETAPDAFYADATRKKRSMRERKAAGDPARGGRPHKASRGKSPARHGRNSRSK